MAMSRAEALYKHIRGDEVDYLFQFRPQNLVKQ